MNRSGFCITTDQFATLPIFHCSTEKGLTSAKKNARPRVRFNYLSPRAFRKQKVYCRVGIIATVVPSGQKVFNDEKCVWRFFGFNLGLPILVPVSVGGIVWD